MFAPKNSRHNRTNHPRSCAVPKTTAATASDSNVTAMGHCPQSQTIPIPQNPKLPATAASKPATIQRFHSFSRAPRSITNANGRSNQAIHIQSHHQPEIPNVMKAGSPSALIHPSNHSAHDNFHGHCLVVMAYAHVNPAQHAKTPRSGTQIPCQMAATESPFMPAFYAFPSPCASHSEAGKSFPLLPPSRSPIRRARQDAAPPEAPPLVA